MSSQLPLSDTTPLLANALASEPTLPVQSIRSLLTPQIVVSVGNYGLLALTEMAYWAILPIYLALPPVSLEPRIIGLLFGTVGLVNGIFQVTVAPWMIERWGIKRMYQVGVTMFIPLWIILPVAESIVEQAMENGVESLKDIWSLWALTMLGLVGLILMDMAWSKQLQRSALPFVADESLLF